MRALNALAVVTAVLIAAPRAEASKPVKRTLKGCVADKVFFSIDGTMAYRISLPEAFDVAPFEGQGVAIEALNLANAVCDGDWCRDDIKKELAEAKKK